MTSSPHPFQEYSPIPQSVQPPHLKASGALEHRVIQPLSETEANLNLAIATTEDQIRETTQTKWTLIAKDVAWVAAIVLLASITIAFVAPTPFALVLIPLALLFLVHCALPVATYVKRSLPYIRAAQADLLKHQTTLEKLKECRQKMSEDSYLHQALMGAESPEKILEKYKDYKDLSSAAEIEYPPEAEL